MRAGTCTRRRTRHDMMETDRIARIMSIMAMARIMAKAAREHTGGGSARRGAAEAEQ